jgi:hypothetical protein
MEELIKMVRLGWAVLGVTSLENIFFTSVVSLETQGVVLKAPHVPLRGVVD